MEKMYIVYFWERTPYDKKANYPKTLSSKNTYAIVPTQITCEI
jgi:hypothetical protein